MRKERSLQEQQQQKKETKSGKRCTTVRRKHVRHILGHFVSSTQRPILGVLAFFDGALRSEDGQKAREKKEKKNRSSEKKKK